MPVRWIFCRGVAIVLAAFFIAVSLCGEYVVWRLAHWARETADDVFGGVKKATGLVQSGAGRVAGLAEACLTELRNLPENVRASEPRSADLEPVLMALRERVETRLEPRIAQAEEALALARNALQTVETTMELLRTLHIVQRPSPELAQLDALRARLQELSGQAAQTREALKAFAGARVGDLRSEAIASLSAQIERLNTGLTSILDQARNAQIRLSRFQESVDSNLARTHFVIGLAALCLTLLLAWNVYAQVIVLRHHLAPSRAQSTGTPSPTAT